MAWQCLTLLNDTACFSAPFTMVASAPSAVKRWGMSGVNPVMKKMPRCGGTMTKAEP